MKIKYPRTPHLLFSPGRTDDDKTLKSHDQFEGKNVVVTMKMDGENFTLARDYCHARSLDSKDHWSRSWIKKFHAVISHDIPEGVRLCGENLYAKHSIKYENLTSYFYLFNIWYHDRCYSWDETLEIAEILGLEVVPVLYDGIWDEDLIVSLSKNLAKDDEGFVVRNKDTFMLEDFQKNVAKYVRKNHIQTDSHWMFAEPEKNFLNWSKMNAVGF